MSAVTFNVLVVMISFIAIFFFKNENLDFQKCALKIRRDLNLLYVLSSSLWAFSSLKERTVLCDPS